MPPKKKVAAAGPTTMKELKDTLWKAADKLRGSLEARDVVGGTAPKQVAAQIARHQQRLQKA